MAVSTIDKVRFKNRQSISVPYTAPSDGIVTVRIAPNDANLAYAYIAVNENNAYGAYIVSQYGADQIAHIPVRNGDVVSLTASNNTRSINYTYIAITGGGVIARLHRAMSHRWRHEREYDRKNIFTCDFVGITSKRNEEYHTWRQRISDNSGESGWLWIGFNSCKERHNNHRGKRYAHKYSMDKYKSYVHCVRKRFGDSCRISVTNDNIVWRFDGSLTAIPERGCA